MPRLPMFERDDLLKHALDLSREYGYRSVTRAMLGEASGVAPSTVSKYFGSMESLREQIVRYALMQKDIVVIAQATIAGHKMAKEAAKSIRLTALEAALS